MKTIKYILSLDWILTKKFFVRWFLLIAGLSETYGLYWMVFVKKEPNWVYVGQLIVAVSGLLAVYTIRKKGEKE